MHTGIGFCSRALCRAVSRSQIPADGIRDGGRHGAGAILLPPASPRQDERVGEDLGVLGRKNSCPGPEAVLG